MPISVGPGSSGAQRYATVAELDAADSAFDAHVADSTGVHGISDTSALLTSAAAAAAYVSEGSAFADIAGYDGVDPTGVAECADDINAALVAIAAAGRRAYAKGTFKIAGTVTIASSADLSDALFNYTGSSGTAVLVGTTTSDVSVDHIDVRLPHIVSTLKVVGEGWSGVGDVGVDVVNLAASRVAVPYVSGFAVNLRVRGVGTGAVHNQITLGHLENGQVNLSLTADATGWCNENLYFGGRFSHESAEGSDVVGTRQIAISETTQPVNNNVFLQPSLEGDVAEFHAEIAGSYNLIVQGRWEASSPKVKWQSDSSVNVIDGGYNSGAIVETIVSGAVRNDVRGHLRHYHTRAGGTSGIAILENTGSSAYPADVVMAAGSRASAAAPATAYNVARSANDTRMKRTGDTEPRLMLDHSNGRVYVGSGSATPTRYIYPVSTTGMGVAGGNWVVDEGYVAFGTELASDAGAPGANGARVYTKDNGSGKTQLVVRFATGAVQVLATEP